MKQRRSSREEIAAAQIDDLSDSFQRRRRSSDKRRRSSREDAEPISTESRQAFDSEINEALRSVGLAPMTKEAGSGDQASNRAASPAELASASHDGDERAGSVAHDRKRPNPSSGNSTRTSSYDSSVRVMDAAAAIAATLAPQPSPLSQHRQLA